MLDVISDESFPLQFRLKSQKLIGQLFKSSQSAFSYPVLLKYLLLPDLPGGQRLAVGFSVPKRNFKTAVKRNRIKRLMREAFRKQRGEWLGSPEEGPAVAMMWICVSDQEPDYAEVYQAVRKCLKKLSAERGAV